VFGLAVLWFIGATESYENSINARRFPNDLIATLIRNARLAWLLTRVFHDIHRTKLQRLSLGRNYFSYDVAMELMWRWNRSGRLSVKHETDGRSTTSPLSAEHEGTLPPGGVKTFAYRLWLQPWQPSKIMRAARSGSRSSFLQSVT